jgi:hypothetical protein
MSRRFFKMLGIAVMVWMLVWPAMNLAQDRPPRPDEPRGDGPPPPQEPLDAPGRPDRPMRPGGPGQGGPGYRSPEMAQLDRMRGYIEVVDRFTRLSRDPAASGVAAVIAASDMLRARGADAAIDYFNKTLPQVKNEAVQRAIRLQLIDLYKASGQQDKALEQMTQLMTSAPAGATPQPIGPEGGPPPPPR